MSFTEEAVQNASYQLHRLQLGFEPQDWKPLKRLGKGISGISEIRIWGESASFRVAYVTKFVGFVVVLHCWKKSSRETSKLAKTMIVNRFKIAKERLK